MAREERMTASKREERKIDVGEVKLHVVTEGEGTPVVLLHGFPEYWYAWRRLMPELAAAGYRAIAPDLRGYDLSDKPEGIRSYTMDRLVGDVTGLVRALGYEKVHLVAHDWGGVIAWHVTARHPEMIDRLVILNAPHPRLYARAMRTWRQLKRGYYVFLFQLPWLPERMIARRATIQNGLAGWASRRDAFSAADIDAFALAVKRPGAATGMINYYRAAVREPRTSAEMRKIERPTLVIWGENDRSLGTELLDGLPDEVRDLTVHRIPGASHWVQDDCPAEVSAEILAFLGRE